MWDHLLSMLVWRNVHRICSKGLACNKVSFLLDRVPPVETIWIYSALTILRNLQEWQFGGRFRDWLEYRRYHSNLAVRTRTSPQRLSFLPFGLLSHLRKECLWYWPWPTRGTNRQSGRRKMWCTIGVACFWWWYYLCDFFPTPSPRFILPTKCISLVDIEFLFCQSTS
jgi:hypothetical protein